MEALDTYPYSGHSALIYRSSRGWQDTGTYWPVSARNKKRLKVVIGHLLKRVWPRAGGWTSPEAGLYGATNAGVQQEMSLHDQKEISAFSEIPIAG